MEIQITGRHASVTEAMKGHALDKLSKLERHNDMVTRAEVVMSIAKNVNACEMIAHTKVGGRVVGKAEHTDMYAAIDLLLDKMDHQLAKQKDKVKVERKHSSRQKASGATAEAASPRKAGRAAEAEGASGDEDADTMEEGR